MRAVKDFCHDTVFKLKLIWVFEIDGLAPAVIDNISDIHCF
jgi:hypothetical protein